MNVRILQTFIVVSVVLVFSRFAVGQSQTLATDSLKSTITIESSTFTRSKPSTVTITVENVSGRELAMKVICSFELLSTERDAIARDFSVMGDSYWSPVDLPANTSLKLDADPKMLKKGIVEGRVPENRLYFDKGEIKTFKLDLTELNWNATMSSFWPRWNLFKAVPKGQYSLQFKVDSTVSFKSNALKVTIE